MMTSVLKTKTIKTCIFTTIAKISRHFHSVYQKEMLNNANMKEEFRFRNIYIEICPIGLSLYLHTHKHILLDNVERV
jgi:hypothetical protein